MNQIQGIPINGADEKTDALPLQTMFNAVPRHYDLINRLMTCYFDQAWRRKAAVECLRGRPGSILDLCTGTGDLALMLAERAGRDTRITAVDFSQPMLDVAGRKAGSCRSGGPLQFVLGDAGRLPFPDEAFDVIGIAFAFRNLTFRNPRTAVYLAEIHRVLKRGGKFVIVETSQPRSAVLRRLFYGYQAVIVTPLGWLVSGQRDAYRYLAWSMRHFYAADELTALLAAQGFSPIVSEPLLGGVAALHVAGKDG
jgi:demethylmenaquinone methyltransferase/2-methoxy-6-polyprenyl-1,4-benzoquinol methylase